MCGACVRIAAALLSAARQMNFRRCVASRLFSALGGPYSFPVRCVASRLVSGASGPSSHAGEGGTSKLLWFVDSIGSRLRGDIAES